MYCEVVGHPPAPLHEGQWPKWISLSLSLSILEHAIQYMLFQISFYVRETYTSLQIHGRFLYAWTRFHELQLSQWNLYFQHQDETGTCKLWFGEKCRLFGISSCFLFLFCFCFLIALHVSVLLFAMVYSTALTGPWKRTTYNYLSAMKTNYL